MARRYLMENEDEIRRLELKTDAATVERFAAGAGLRQGMRVADVFCGAGLTTSILAGLVGPGGSATGYDASEARISHARERYGDGRTDFRIADALVPFPDPGRYDFVWVRFGLEYFRAEAFDIVRNLTGLLADDGILCLVDLDHNCLNHYGMDDRLAGAFAGIMAELEEKANFDPYAGRKLYSHLFRLGFRDIRMDAGAHHLIYGELNEVDRFNWTKKVRTAALNAGIRFPGYASGEEFLEDFLRFFEDPSRFTYTPVIACWGRKPSA